jgi:hypothetical protein
MPNMTQNRLAAIAFRGFILAVFAFWAFAPSAHAQPVQAAKAASLTGVYNGTYAGEQGPIKFKLTITQQDNGALAGSCTLYLPEGADTKEYTCDVRGRYISANRRVQVLRGKWETPPPAGVDMPGMNGLFDPDGGSGAGQIAGTMRARPGPQFQAVRDADESAKMVAAVAAEKAAAPPAVAGARQTRQQQAVPKPAAAPPPSSPAPGPDAASPTAINGVYTGGYEVAGAVGVGGSFKAKLSLKSTDDGSLTGLFTFDLPPSSGSRSATYKLTGRYVAGNRWPFQFTTVEPMGKPAPDFYAIKSLSACFAQGPPVMGRNGHMEYSVNPDHISGPVHGQASVGFAAVRDKAESADLDKVMMAQASAAIAVSTTAPAAPVVRLSYEGVFNGTYTAKQGPTKFKLTLWMQHENRTLEGELLNTNIAGLLTLYLSEGSGTKAYTSVLTGIYTLSQNLQVTSGRWEPPLTGNFRMAGLQGRFNPGGNDSSQISGYMSDATNSKFQAIRDVDESARMDPERLRNPIRPGFDGVFNGTYSRASGPPTKFKLTMTHNGNTAGLAGLATIYLPVGSGTKAYTYDLKGIETGHDEFQLRANDWATMPPRDFQNLRSMGFEGAVVVDLVKNTARIVSVPATVADASDFVPQFEATWDATESADIKGVIAAQKAVDAADYAAAMKARDENVRNAPPKQLASRDLVRKSRVYWDGYQTDMIREVFDGGFGAAIDENQQFQLLFCTYVEMYSAKYAALLPANHQTVTVTQNTNRKFDNNGNLINQNSRSVTVEVDSRLAPKYRQFVEGLGSSKNGLGPAIVAMASGASPRDMINNLLAPAHDMQRFFANHDGKSAAMRQLTENFVRGASGEPSLQQADGKVDGAQAETDKDLPPGRYARFVDGANAYFRERAKADPTKFGSSSSHDTAFCQRLAELCQSDMSREEEYFYANDFEGRFAQIMGSRANCPDPVWPRLHPDVEKCIEEVR